MRGWLFFPDEAEAGTEVNFLSSAEVYKVDAVAFNIASGSYTPHGSAAEVVLVIAGRPAGADTIGGYTVTIDSVSPDEEVFIEPTGSSAEQNLWIGRWRGAPSGTVEITSIPGDAGSQWNNIVAVGISLDRASIFGASTTRADDDGTATTSGERSFTSEQADSIGIIAASVNRNIEDRFTPNVSFPYTEIYDDTPNVGGQSSADLSAHVGHLALGSVGSKSVQTDWTTADEWAHGFWELKADTA